MIHLSDDEISLYAIERELVDSPDSAEAHVADCTSCRGLFDVHERFDETLRASEPWLVADPSADPHRQSLRAMALQTQREDDEADLLLAPLLAEPDQAAWSELVKDPRYRTGGVVRRLCEAAHQVCAVLPAQALTVSGAAIAIAIALPDDLYPARAVFALRGLAWKEQTNALRSLDRFREALKALESTEACFTELVAPDFDLGIVWYNRGFVLAERDDFHEAEDAANTALALLRHFGQDSRLRFVYCVADHVLLQRGDFARAIKAFERILSSPPTGNDAFWVGIVKANLGWCHLDAGDPLTAAPLFREGRAGLLKLAVAGAVTRCDWGLALVTRDLGHHREALAQLLAVSAAFEKQQVVVDSAAAMVEAFEIMLALGQADDIERLATGLVETLTEAGRIESALTALAYIKEAAARKSITPEILRAARTFLRRVEHHRGLIFVPPPVA